VLAIERVKDCWKLGAKPPLKPISIALESVRAAHPLWHLSTPPGRLRLICITPSLAASSRLHGGVRGLI
jgi:hypothetical protein